MNKALLILLITVLKGLGASAETLRISVYDFPPHIFVQNGKPQGPGITFYQTYLNHTPGVKLQWIATPFARVLQDLQHGKTDVALFLARSPEREKFLRFSDTALFTTSSAIIVRSDSPLVKAKSLKDFKGLTLGHSKDSFTPHELIRQGIKIEALSGEDVIERNIQKLRYKRLDGIFIPTASNGEYILHKIKAEKEFQLFIVPNSNLNLHIAFSKNIEEKTFQRIEKALKKNHDAYRKLLEQQLHK
ncbi:substrate-binding periplasmic protein [Bdellovibrio bacteriovorus]|uniref:substrate-binding periplasmic protein n=1 Tax=Bdellovibrio bacteriovorus TaxID=959 RepID=UPI0035A6D0E8